MLSTLILIKKKFKRPIVSLVNRESFNRILYLLLNKISPRKRELIKSRLGDRLEYGVCSKRPRVDFHSLPRSSLFAGNSLGRPASFRQKILHFIALKATTEWEHPFAFYNINLSTLFSQPLNSAISQLPRRKHERSGDLKSIAI